MSDNVAVLEGFTKEYMAKSATREFPILVKPGTPFGGTFKAWDMDEQKFVRIDGREHKFTPAGERK